MSEKLSAEAVSKAQREGDDEQAGETLRGSYLYLVQTGVASLLLLVSVPIVTHKLEPQEYGIFALAQVYATIVTGIANLGMVIGYERNFFKYEEDSEKSGALLYSVTTFVALNLVVVGIAAFLWREDLARMILGSSGYEALLILVFAGTALASLTSYYLTYLKNKGQATTYVKISIGQSLSNFCLILTMLLLFDTGVEGLAWALFVSNVSVFLVVLAREIQQFTFSFNRQMFIDVLKISWPLTPRIFFGFLGTQFDKIMLGMLATIGGVGIYSIAQNASYVVFQFMTALDRVFIPQVYRKLFSIDEKDSGRSIGRYLTPFAYASIFIALLIVLFSEELFVVLLPESYAAGIDVVIILSLFYATMFFGKITGTQLIYAKKAHISSLLTLVGVVLNILLNIPMIIQWGVIGAACATCLAGIVSGFISFRVAQHYVRVEWEWGTMGWIFGIFACAAMVTLGSHMFLENYYWGRLCGKFVLMACYLYLGVQIGFVTPGNMRTMYATATAMFSRKAGSY